MLFTSILALASAVALAVTTPTTHTTQKYYLQITTDGIDKRIDALNNFYVSNKPTTFFELNSLIFLSSVTDAITFTIDLYGTHPVFDNGHGMHLSVLGVSQFSTVVFSEGVTDSEIEIVNGNGTSKLHVDKSGTDFGGWLACVSQYGAVLGWATTDYNATEVNDGSPPQDVCGFGGLRVVEA